MKKTYLKKAGSFLMQFAGLAFLMAVFAIASGGASLSARNMRLILEQSIILIFASTGLMFVMTMGMMDLSVGAGIGMCCLVIAKVCSVNIPLGLVCGLLTGLLIGLINGWLTATLKIGSFLATLCMRYILTGLLVQFISKEAVTVPFALYAADKFSYKLIGLVVCLVLAGFLFDNTPFGSKVRMIGSNENAAFYTGIHVTRVKIICYVLCGFFVSVAAFLTAIRTGTAAVNTGSDMMFNAMIALVMGGFPAGGGSKVRFSAPIIGGIMLQVLSNGLTILGMNATLQQFLKGGLFLVIVILVSQRENTEFIQRIKNRISIHKSCEAAQKEGI